MPTSTIPVTIVQRRFGETSRRAKRAEAEAILLRIDAAFDKVAEAHEGMCVDSTHIGRQCIRKDDHQVIMDMHLYQVKGGKNLPIARIAGNDSIGEAMVGKDPVEGFTWEIKKK